LQQLWESPLEARTWVTDVVGEAIVTTCDGCAKDSVPGTGLLPKKLAEQTTITADLRDLVSGTTAPTLENLEVVTAPGVAVTRQVIEAIQEMPPSEQGLIAGRLVAEIATARTLERALMARRLLLSGRQVPEVYAASVAREHADTAVAELDREIENLLFETRVRREVVSDTVVTLLQRAAARRQASMSIPSVPVIDPTPLKDGRVEQ
jgi:integrating conjugative element protein (TIGR03755 family)